MSDHSKPAHLTLSEFRANPARVTDLHAEGRDVEIYDGDRRVMRIPCLRPLGDKEEVLRDELLAIAVEALESIWQSGIDHERLNGAAIKERAETALARIKGADDE